MLLGLWKISRFVRVWIVLNTRKRLLGLTARLAFTRGDEYTVAWLGRSDRVARVILFIQKRNRPRCQVPWLQMAVRFPALIPLVGDDACGEREAYLVFGGGVFSVRRFW